MTNDSAFLPLSSDDAATTMGGGPIDFIVKTIVAIVVAECVKYSADFKAGYRAGYDEAFK